MTRRAKKYAARKPARAAAKRIARARAEAGRIPFVRAIGRDNPALSRLLIDAYVEGTTLARTSASIAH